MAPNGNYVEPEAIAVRHGVCGDPRQVNAMSSCIFTPTFTLGFVF